MQLTADLLSDPRREGLFSERLNWLLEVYKVLPSTRFLDLEEFLGDVRTSLFEDEIPTPLVNLRVPSEDEWSSLLLMSEDELVADPRQWRPFDKIALPLVQRGLSIAIHRDESDQHPLVVYCGDLIQYLLHGKIGPRDKDEEVLWVSPDLDQNDSSEEESDHRTPDSLRFSFESLPTPELPDFAYDPLLDYYIKHLAALKIKFPLLMKDHPGADPMVAFVCLGDPLSQSEINRHVSAIRGLLPRYMSFDFIHVSAFAPVPS